MNHHSLDSLQVMHERNVTNFAEASCCSVRKVAPGFNLCSLMSATECQYMSLIDTRLTFFSLQFEHCIGMLQLSWAQCVKWVTVFFCAQRDI